MKRHSLEHRFVSAIPEVLEDGVLYVSIAYATSVHRCCCGCGREVVTPFSPTDWAMVYDGASVSLKPSIGNWSFPCQSHYWIERDRIRWAERWSPDQIESGRRRDRIAKGITLTKDAVQTPTPSHVPGWLRLRRALQSRLFRR